MKVHIENAEGIRVLRPEGDLDALGHVALVEALEEQFGQAPALAGGQEEGLEVILDLSCVDYINSICVGYIVQFWRDATRGGGFFAIAGARREVRRLLEVGGVHRYINLYDTLEAAVAGCQAGESPKTLLDEKSILELVKNFSRISLSRALNAEVTTAEIPTPPPSWDVVRVTGDVSGLLAVALDPESSRRIAGRLLEGLPECDDPQSAVEHIERVVIDSAFSGLEEMGYEFEMAVMEKGVKVAVAHSLALETPWGSVLLGINLRKLTTKRRRRVAQT
ncbi:MAG: STAS domain-containing protein [Planctomycetes bacterium]|nr:STAS domain-containing protein [Planctomycetota bacterium]